jgi:hypothetical protein
VKNLLTDGQTDIHMDATRFRNALRSGKLGMEKKYGQLRIIYQCRFRGDEVKLFTENRQNNAHEKNQLKMFQH